MKSTKELIKNNQEIIEGNYKSKMNEFNEEFNQ